MNEKTSTPPPESLLRIGQVQARVGLKKSSIYEQVRLGTFPAPLKLSRKVSCWTASSIDTWIHERIEAAKKGK